jgi:hypothetical protein
VTGDSLPRQDAITMLEAPWMTVVGVIRMHIARR